MSSTPTPPPLAELGAGGRDPIPLLLAGLLALALALQLALPPSPPPALATTRAGRLAGTTLASAVAGPVSPPDPMILARSLFSASRSAAALQTAAPVGALSLLGVALSGRQALATVQGASGAVRTVRPGEEVEGWRLVAVGRDRASFARGGVVQALRVGMGPAQPAVVQPGAAPATLSATTPGSAGGMDRR